MAHPHPGVRIGPQFVLRSLAARLEPDAALRRREQPLRVVVRCDVARRWERSGTLVGADWTFDIAEPDGTRVAGAAASVSWIPRPDWAAVRAGLRRYHGLPDE